MTSDVAKQPDAPEAVSDEVREEQKNLTSRAEAIARIIAPTAYWGDPDTNAEQQDAFAKAYAILRLPPLLDGGCSSSRDHAPDADARTPESARTEQVQP